MDNNLVKSLMMQMKHDKVWTRILLIYFNSDNINQKETNKELLRGAIGWSKVADLDEYPVFGWGSLLIVIFGCVFTY